LFMFVSFCYFFFFFSLYLNYTGFFFFFFFYSCISSVVFHRNIVCVYFLVYINYMALYSKD